MMNHHGSGEKGSGKMKTDSYKLATFDQISTSIPGKINVVVGSSVSVKVETDDNLIDDLDVVVKNGTLHLDTKNDIRPTKVIFTITVPSLKALELSGAGDVNITKIKTKSFDLDLSGAANVKLAGEVTNLKIDVSGASDIDAKALKAQIVNLDMSGAGSARLSVSQSLTADISGACSVRYFGDPKVTKSISGVGSIKKG